MSVTQSILEIETGKRSGTGGLASRPAGLTHGSVSTCTVFAGSILCVRASAQAEAAADCFKPFTAVASLVEVGDMALLGVPPPSFSSPSSSLQEVQL